MIKPSVSVFFPCFNDEKTISQLVRGAKKALEKAAAKYEIIVIDDGSTDDSRGELSKLRREIRNLRLIFHRQNRGYGGVLRSGFKAAKYDLVFYTDGDGQYDVRDLELLFPLLTPDIDVVNGIKMERNDAWYRKLAGYGYNFLVRNLFNIRIFDVDCDFRLIRKTKLQGIDLGCSSGAICVELVKKLQDNGAGFREVTVHHYERKFGSSQFFKPKRLWQTAIELIKLWTEIYLK
ncbi:glycosyltransferase family 2 protein [Candidatus Collierbacteria bacterium]|nr:glycosyltransferase family 2 protein [Candidatus Collierbacteria bacterium]